MANNSTLPDSKAMSSVMCTMLIAVVVFLAQAAQAQATGQRTFPSFKEAVQAFVGAIRSGNSTELLATLGPGSEQIISSGDEVADKTERQRFIEKYDFKHSLSEPGPHQLTLDIGQDEWPLPIPLAELRCKWYFDGAVGKDEILYRRIGHNEIAAMGVCRGVVAAQHDYAASADDDAGARTYAQRIVSEPGKPNGLYWEVKQGEPLSAAGPLLARAAEEGYDTSKGRTPYHGYLYHLLITGQGPHAKGGAKPYLIDGKMSGGFGLVAYPSDYRVSGVMTSIVNQDGVIYQKDLGEKTAEVAGKMSEYDPDSSWTIAK